MKPPVEPMLAKFADELPPAGGYVYEPKWDGFRAIVFRGEDEVYIQSRDSRPLDRCFPERHDALLDRLPKNCVVDGEIVIATARGLDFDALRLHPLNGDWSPDRYPIDIANTWFADSYAIWGLKIGRTADRGLSWFIEGRNPSDREYAATSGVIADARGIDTAQFFPGDGRAVYAGIAWRTQ